MSVREEALSASSPLVASKEAATGWSVPGLSLVVETRLCAALVTVRRDMGGELAAEALERLGAALSPDRGVSLGQAVAIVSCGRGRYLAIKPGDTDRALLSVLQRSLERLAAVVDYSDQLVFFRLGGAAAPRVLATLCSIDLDTPSFPARTAIVARMQDVRAHVWREDDPAGFVVGVPRSLALGSWEALLQASKTQMAATIS